MYQYAAYGVLPWAQAAGILLQSLMAVEKQLPQAAAAEVAAVAAAHT